MHLRYRILVSGALLSLLALAPAAYATAYDPVTITQVAAGHGKMIVSLQAGASGAPNGFTLWWMTQADFDANGDYWSDTPVPGKDWAVFNGTPTLNTGGGTYTSFQLAPFQSIDVEIGDLFDETGLSTNYADELQQGVTYVFCAFVDAGATGTRSSITATYSTTTTATTNCTFTQGYWKNHPGVWPVPSLTLGTVSYTQAQLLSILGTPAAGNGLISLAHQLIAAKLNIANGADPTAISGTISSADALIGGLVVPPVGSDFLAPASTSALTQALDDYNNGITGPGHCTETPAHTTTWGQVKTLYR